MAVPTSPTRALVGDGILLADAVPGDRERAAVFENDDLLLLDAGFPGELAVLDEMAVLAVHGNEVFRPDRFQHFPELLALSVA